MQTELKFDLSDYRLTKKFNLKPKNKKACGICKDTVELPHKIEFSWDKETSQLYYANQLKDAKVEDILREIVTPTDVPCITQKVKLCEICFNKANKNFAMSSGLGKFGISLSDALNVSGNTSYKKK